MINVESIKITEVLTREERDFFEGCILNKMIESRNNLCVNIPNH
jgi:hypothetical protein